MSERAGIALRRTYQPKPYDGRVVCFRAVGTDPEFPIADYSYRWRRASTTLEVLDVPGNHAAEGSMLTQPHATVLGDAMCEILQRTTAASSMTDRKRR